MRINLSVPDELKQRMDQLTHVNWSEVARHAFELELNKLTVTGMNMEKVVERLRASKAQHISSEEEYGITLGKAWAAEYAEFSDLKSLEDVDVDDEEACRLAMGSIQSEYSVDNVEMFEERDPSDERIQGFVKGAQLVWAEVKHLL